jgi:hypothetical protein
MLEQLEHVGALERWNTKTQGSRINFVFFISTPYRYARCISIDKLVN